MLRKTCLFFLSLFLVLVVISHPVSPAFAALADPGASGYDPSLYDAPYQNPNPATVTESLSNCESLGLTCIVSSIEGTLESLIPLKITGATNKAGQPIFSGAIPFFTSGIVTMATTPPASSGDYVKYMASRLQVPGTAKVAYAAGPGGLGYTSLAPVLGLWTAVRNIAYILFAIFFVIVGLMIMFRLKIDPKTAANIQNALPKVIFALILVTFSYAIAGFLIDLMYVAIALILTIAKSIGGFGTFPAEFERNVLSGQTIFSFFLSGGVQLSLNAFQEINNIVTQFLKNSAAQGASGPLGFLSGGLAFLIVAVALLWALFKTWLSLLGAYVAIILSIVFSPFMLMLDALPGQNLFAAWIRMMLSNLLAFPMVIGMMFVGLALGGGYGTNITPQAGFVPPLIGGNSQSSIQSLIGIGIVLTIPKALAILQEILKSPQFKYGTAFLEAVKFGVSPEKMGYNRFVTRNVASREGAWEQYEQEESRGGRPMFVPGIGYVHEPVLRPVRGRPNVIARNIFKPFK